MFRFSIREMMLITAVVALGIALYMEHRLTGQFRAQHFRELADFHRDQLPPPRDIRATAFWRMRLKLMASDNPSDRAREEYFFSMDKYHAEAASRYDRAAESPWSTPTLPPMPEEPPTLGPDTEIVVDLVEISEPLPKK